MSKTSTTVTLSNVSSKIEALRNKTRGKTLTFAQRRELLALYQMNAELS